MGRSQSSNLIKVWDLFLMLLGFLYLAVFSLEVLADLSNSQVAILETASFAIFIVFACDVVFRFASSYKQLTSLKGWIDFLKLNWLGIVALFAPMMRSLAALRVLVVLRGLAPFLQSRVSKLSFYVGVALPLVIYTASLSVLEAEQYNSEANIKTLSDAIWWSLVTVTTVGFGDRYPVTAEGRTVASFLIFVGIALFSTLTAVIASWVLAEKVKSE
jgi:voltage-gated potassium channel